MEFDGIPEFVELDVITEVKELVENHNMLWSIEDSYHLPQDSSGNPWKSSLENKMNISAGLFKREQNRETLIFDKKEGIFYSIIFWN